MQEHWNGAESRWNRGGDFTTDLGNEGNPEGTGRRECCGIFILEYQNQKSRNGSSRIEGKISRPLQLCEAPQNLLYSMGRCDAIFVVRVLRSAKIASHSLRLPLLRISLISPISGEIFLWWCGGWWREWELNPRPKAYESSALPLSYPAPKAAHTILKTSTPVNGALISQEEKRGLHH
jgi:hypothetical protein